MIVFDTETTGLVLKGQKLSMQPHVIEYVGIKLDDKTLEEIGRLKFRCKPPISIPADAVKIHNISDEMVKDEKPFAAHFKAMQEFHLGERTMVAHNIEFDKSLLSFEMQRIQMIQKFPWAPEHICTVEKSYSIHNRRLKLAQLHQLATGIESIDGAHSAEADTEALVKCVRWMREKGML